MLPITFSMGGCVRFPFRRVALANALRASDAGALPSGLRSRRRSPQHDASFTLSLPQQPRSTPSPKRARRDASLFFLLASSDRSHRCWPPRRSPLVFQNANPLSSSLYLRVISAKPVPRCPARADLAFHFGELRAGLSPHSMPSASICSRRILLVCQCPCDVQASGVL
jgi:hypothetical protein